MFSMAMTWRGHAQKETGKRGTHWVRPSSFRFVGSAKLTRLNAHRLFLALNANLTHLKIGEACQNRRIFLDSKRAIWGIGALGSRRLGFRLCWAVLASFLFFFWGGQRGAKCPQEQLMAMPALPVADAFVRGPWCMEIH